MKAETTVGPIIAILIILALLSIAFAAYPQGVRSILERFNLLTPKDNPDSQQVKPELFRYDIEKDVVEYYDGSFFTDFRDDTKEVNDKRVSYEGIYKDFKDFFYNRNARERVKRIELNQGLSGMIVDFETYEQIDEDDPTAWPFDLCILWIETATSEEIAKRGDVTMKLVGDKAEDCKGTNYGELTMSANGEIKLRSVEESIKILQPERSRLKNQEAEKEIREIALSWRNSILSKPITIGYEKKIDKDNYVSESDTFCASIIDNIYLVVDISQSTEKESCATTIKTEETPAEKTEEAERKYFSAGLDIITDPESFPLKENINARSIFLLNEKTGSSTDTKIYIITSSGEIRVKKDRTEDPLVGSIKNDMITITSTENLDEQTVIYLTQLNQNTYASLFDGEIDYAT